MQFERARPESCETHVSSKRKVAKATFVAPVAVLALGGFLLACAPLVPAVGMHSVDAANVALGERVETSGSITFVEDDFAAAMARAKAEGKALFVDAWAPWCHTCLSMKHYVFNDPSLKALEDRVVFASIDTDRPSSAEFVATHAIRVWPMFFVLDPTSDRVVGAWPGSASLSELRAFVDQSLVTLDGERAGSLSKDDPLRLIADARALAAGGKADDAAVAFERALTALPVSHPRRSEVLQGLIFAQYAAKNWAKCAETGLGYVGEVTGAAVPADFASFLLACSEQLDSPMKEKGRLAAIVRLRQLTQAPSIDASADDQADAWGILADALGSAGDAAGARKAREMKLNVLEKAANSATSSEAAATFDYARAMTYVELGKGGFAIAMLEGREREMPTSYEPPARLASVLFKLGRYEGAKGAIDRAVGRAYGPRKLGYLKLRAQILMKLGDVEGALATLREEVRGHETLPQGHESPNALADAKRRLAAASGTPTDGARNQAAAP